MSSENEEKTGRMDTRSCITTNLFRELTVITITLFRHQGTFINFTIPMRARDSCKMEIISSISYHLFYQWKITIKNNHFNLWIIDFCANTLISLHNSVLNLMVYIIYKCMCFFWISSPPSFLLAFDSDVPSFCERFNKRTTNIFLCYCSQKEVFKYSYRWALVL